MEHNVDVKIIRYQGRAALVECVDKGVPRRFVVPREAVDGGSVSPEELALGIEYGEPWEELWTPQVTPEAVATALRRRGLWTVEDLRREPGKAVAALQSVYGLDLSTLLAIAERAASGRDGEKR
jgi:hypothetical protein